MAAIMARMQLRLSSSNFMLIPASQRLATRNLLTSSARSGAKDKESSIDNNPFYEKYADRIKELQKSKPEVYQSRLGQVREAHRREERGQAEQAKKPSLSDQPKPTLKSAKETGNQKSLDAIVKVELLRQHSAEEITEIWRDFHKEKDFICAVIPSNSYAKIHQRAKDYPMFLYPVPRDEGYEFFFAQFDHHSCYFTSVINYQAYQENAPSLLTIAHYPDLQEEKGIVLMRGEMDTKFLSVQDAQFLANQLQMYYATDDEERLKLLHDFNRQPNDFKHMDLVSQLSNTTVKLG